MLYHLSLWVTWWFDNCLNLTFLRSFKKMKFVLQIFLILSSAFTIPAGNIKLQSKIFDKVDGRLQAMTSKIYSLTTPFYCASKCQSMNNTCFGFNYNVRKMFCMFNHFSIILKIIMVNLQGSVCEIITSYNEQQHVTGKPGYGYYTERCPPKVIVI